MQILYAVTLLFLNKKACLLYTKTGSNQEIELKCIYLFTHSFILSLVHLPMCRV